MTSLAAGGDLRRIHITGNAGAGKTRFARRLAAATDLPLHHLDGIVWRSGWRKAPRDQRLAQEAELADQACWIIEGVSVVARDRADLVVFLDLHPSRCLVRAGARCLRLGTATRPELPADCPEWRVASRLPGIVGGFSGQASRIRDEARREPDRFRIFRDNATANLTLPRIAQRVLSPACR